jgi:hypothetical protein
MPGYDDDSGISGIGLTPVDDLDASYSSPEASGSGGHSAGGSSQGSGGYHPGLQHSMQPMSHSYHGYGGTHHGYTSSVSSTATSGGYGPAGHSQSGSPYLSHGQRLPSVDMGIDAIMNRPNRGAHGV